MRWGQDVSRFFDRTVQPKPPGSGGLAVQPSVYSVQRRFNQPSGLKLQSDRKHGRSTVQPVGPAAPVRFLKHWFLKMVMTRYGRTTSKILRKGVPTIKVESLIKIRQLWTPSMWNSFVMLHHQLLGLQFFRR